MKPYGQQAKLFKILMHPTRLAILQILRHSEECVCHMESVLGQRQAYISQQLMVLREAGLVQDRRDGWNIFYQVTKPEIYAVIDAANSLVDVDRTEKGQTMPGKTIKSCECPKCKTEVS